MPPDYNDVVCSERHQRINARMESYEVEMKEQRRDINEMRVSLAKLIGYGMGALGVLQILLTVLQRFLPAG
jgi:hypothetical protein